MAASEPLPLGDWSHSALGYVSSVLELNGESYRLRDTKQKRPLEAAPFSAARLVYFYSALDKCHYCLASVGML